MSVRGLARLLGPTRIEQERRAIRRWLVGQTPHRVNRDRVTDALGLERGALDPDDEEDRLAGLDRDQLELLAILNRALSNAVREAAGMRGLL